VYVTAKSTSTFERRLVELSLEHPRGFVTGPTLGGLRGLRRMPRHSKIHFSVPHPARFEVPNHIELRQSTLILPEHIERLPNGMSVASWPRLAFDLAADLTKTHLASVIEQMLHRNVVSIPQLVAIAKVMCARGRPGSRTFGQTLLEHHGGVPAESDPELHVLTELLRRGVPVEPQVGHLELPNGRRVRLDMAVPAIRWGIEVDIHPAHLDLLGTTSDKQRDRQLHLIDWQVDRVTQLDMLDFLGTLDELEAIYYRRVENLSSRSTPIPQARKLLEGFQRARAR
jgi:hypothetical protein